MKVLAFGEILWDVINGVEHLGGAPFNFAAHMAQCGHETFMVSRLGMDELGAFTRMMDDRAALMRTALEAQGREIEKIAEGR